MTRQWHWRMGLAVVVFLAGAGCRQPAPEPSALGEEMTRQMRLAAPTVGGPSEEFAVDRKPDRIARGAQTALKGAGVRLIREGHSDTGRWLLGKSLANRDVLVQVLPVYPGRSRVRITVEGGDALARELLTRLSADLKHEMR